MNATIDDGIRLSSFTDQRWNGTMWIICKILVLPKNGKRSLIKMGHKLLNKVILFHENIVFYFLEEKKIRNF